MDRELIDELRRALMQFITWAEHPMRGLADQTTQVRVSWRTDQTVREVVVRRLRDLFPQARIGVRRW